MHRQEDTHFHGVPKRPCSRRQYEVRNRRPWTMCYHQRERWHSEAARARSEPCHRTRRRLELCQTWDEPDANRMVSQVAYNWGLSLLTHATHHTAPSWLSDFVSKLMSSTAAPNQLTPSMSPPDGVLPPQFQRSLSFYRMNMLPVAGRSSLSQHRATSQTPPN